MMQKRMVKNFVLFSALFFSLSFSAFARAEEGALPAKSPLLFLDQNTPLKVGKQTLHFRIVGEQVKPRLSLRIFMEGHAMSKDHKIVHLLKGKDGVWEGKFPFMMGGDWLIEALLLRRNAAPFKQVYPVHVLWK